MRSSGKPMIRATTRTVMTPRRRVPPRAFGSGRSSLSASRANSMVRFAPTTSVEMARTAHRRAKNTCRVFILLLSDDGGGDSDLGLDAADGSLGPENLPGEPVSLEPEADPGESGGVCGARTAVVQGLAAIPALRRAITGERTGHYRVSQSQGRTSQQDPHTVSCGLSSHLGEPEALSSKSRWAASTSVLNDFT